MAAARNKRRNRRSRGRLGRLLKVLCLLAVVAAATVGATVFFKVETVAVSGTVRYTQEEVIQATGIQVGDNLFRMNKFRVSEQVREALPYVGELTIRRSLPSTIVITVTEWDAVARIEVPEEPVLEETEEGETPLAAAREPWLINIGGKLLEPAGADSDAISVTGITPLAPSAGSKLALPQKEGDQYNALLALLAALEEKDLLDQVAWMELDTTQVRMGYLDRFKVKLPLNGDFPYLLRAMTGAVADLDQRVGPDCTGTLDLTQKGYQVSFSAD